MTVWVESGVVAMVAMLARLNMMQLLLGRRQLYHSWVMVSLKLWMGKRMHGSLLFHCLRSLAVPQFPIRKPSRWYRCPLVGVPSVTPDEVETLATEFIPGSRASFFDLDATNDLGPAHFQERLLRRGEWT